MLELTDTHCHIQFADYPLDVEEVIVAAKEAGVTRLLVVGCTLPDSEAGSELATRHQQLWAAIGLHPHEASAYVRDSAALQHFRDLATKQKVVAIGEIGLDYYYKHSSKDDQLKLLRYQLELGLEHNLPFIFHVREAFEDFWKIFDEYARQTEIRGVMHSFSAGRKELEQILSRNLHVGLNGIMTFTKQAEQLECAKTVPSDKLLLETDAPFLTPAPFRGKVCEPKHVRVTAEFLATVRGDSLDQIAEKTTNNAQKLFNLL